MANAWKAAMWAAWCSCACMTVQTVRAAEPYAGYVMGYFTESPQRLANDYGLHLAYSTNGLNWVPLNNNNAVVYPALGQRGLRDPFILRKNDGMFVVLATDMAGTDFAKSSSESIHVWDSPDLRSFNNERLGRVNTSGMHSWAPEAFHDASRGQYAVVWSGNATSASHQIFVNYTTDFVNFGAPQVFFDPGFSPLDATLHVHGGSHGDYYMHHSNFQGRMDPYPFDPYADSQWRIVPGLADANGISFASVNYPGHYLRHFNYNLVLNRNDDTGQFKADATFYKVPGLADAAWSSFRSYNFPAMYIRHANFVLRIDPISTTPDRQSATFGLVR